MSLRTRRGTTDPELAESVTLDPASVARLLYLLRSAAHALEEVTHELEGLAGLIVDPERAKRQASRFAAHVRHHVKTKRPKAGCEFCR